MPPSVVDALFYLPALIGLYSSAPHRGQWMGRQEKTVSGPDFHQHDEISGRQTVRNMLVMTVLLAGAYFASFYAPMMLSSSGTSVASPSHDYLYHYRCDQDMIGQNDVAQLAQKHNVDITTWVTATGSILGTDGMEHIETESSIGVTYTEEYRELPKAPPSCLSVPTTRSLAKRSTLLPALVPMFSMTTRRQQLPERW